MKKVTFIGLAIFGLSMAFTGCKGKTEPAPHAEEEVVTSNDITYDDTVHLSTAQKDISYYVGICIKEFGDEVPIRAYTINKADLYGVLGVKSIPNCKYETCRAYIGMDEDNKFKLFMTPTVKVASAKGSSDSIYVDQIPYDSIHNTYFVYDLNAPCPSTCDKSSKLFVGPRYK